MLRIFIWGTGKIAEDLLEQYNVYDEYELLGFIDNNLQKQGKAFGDKEIFSPSVLYDVKPDKIVILSDYYDEISRQIIHMFPDMQNLIENKNYFYKKSILRRYDNVDDIEIKTVLKYIKENELQVFNYDFADKYKYLKVDITYDNNCGMYYVYHQGKKLYFAKVLDTELKVKEYYKSLLVEQDEASPHRYLTPQFDVNEGDVVVDIGVAEGNFSLEIIEKASKVYIIETDNGWIEALKETFKDYQEKVVIIQKYVTSINENKNATLDSLIKEPVNFIKMDIEGNEWDALLGAENLIRNSEKLKCAVCSYHADFDEVLIRDVLGRYGLECSVTPGYMWFPAAGRKAYISLKLCRGLVLGIKR
ncbi:methyltransferase FkbM-like protein [Kineothrix alysoides]|uniref:Methyltransferase FkbM-like protein n=1 Tax=Kineothrix alysoides TaxID=1469948 RepID=A0A4R1QYS7_9FIRM|nr:FkbM family methyltransferase [Kineothrix alysoides]TCL58120.1 methyltransferase FkbM-like protein [Kineothrix alysoides]